MRWTFLRLVLLFGTTAAAHAAALFLVGEAWKSPLAGVFLALIPLAAYRLVVRLAEGRSARELALPGAPALLGAGVIVGLGLFAAVYAVLGATGHLTFRGPAGTAGLSAAVGLNALAAVGEEIILRGAVFRVLEDGFGTLVALVLSAALFGLLHGANPGATATSTMAIALEAGVLLGLAYAATRSLWLPIGLHFGWNFTEGGVFGAAVSGMTAHGLLRFDVTGPDLVTGGAFGPEASIVAVVVCLAAAVAFGVAAARRGRWQPARLRMKLRYGQDAA